MRDYSKTYIIKKGHHYVRWFQMFPMFHRNIKKVYFEIKFDPSCYWFPSRDNDDTDKNKLFGLGFGFNHHKNSLRLAWVPNFSIPKNIDIYAYSYDANQKEVTRIFITTVKVGKSFKGKITGLNKSRYLIVINDQPISIPNNSKDKNWGFYLRPYVGGNNTAIRTMKIDVSWFSTHNSDFI